jgi:hypothetical protein
MIKPKFKICSWLLIFSLNLFASDFFSGSRPMALGGAYTSVNGDVYSLYHNPAGLYGGKNVSVNIDLSGGYNFSGSILNNINSIIDTAQKFEKIKDAQKTGSGIDVTQINLLFKAIKNLNDISSLGNGVLVDINGGVAVKIKNFGFGVRNYTMLGARPEIDTSFYLGSGTVNTSSIIKLSQGTKFVEGIESFSGITIPQNSTGPVPSELSDTQIQLVKIIDDFIKPQLESLGVTIPSDLTTEQIANALINVAVANNVDTQEIKDAVKTLSDTDFQRIISQLISDKFNTKNVFTDNKSSLVFKGLNVTELNFSYSQEMFLPKLYLGGSLKYLIGTAMYKNYLVFNETDKLDFNDLSSLQQKITKNSNAITLDIGAMYELPLPVVNARTGVVIKNLLEPQFDLPETEQKLKLPRQVTFGISADVWKRIILAIDYDLLKTETFVEGYYKQNLGLGLEVDLPVLPTVRIGYVKNVVMDKEELLTCGIGIKLFILYWDITAALSTNSVNIDEKTAVPYNASLSTTLSFRF